MPEELKHSWGINEFISQLHSSNSFENVDIIMPPKRKRAQNSESSAAPGFENTGLTSRRLHRKIDNITYDILHLPRPSPAVT